MFSLTHTLFAVACAALVADAHAENLPEGNEACATLVMGINDMKLTTEVQLPEQHINMTDVKVVILNKIKKPLVLVGVKIIACDFLTGKPPTIKMDKNNALKPSISCDQSKPRCRVGLEIMVFEYGIKALQGPHK